MFVLIISVGGRHQHGWWRATEWRVQADIVQALLAITGVTHYCA